MAEVSAVPIPDEAMAYALRAAELAAEEALDRGGQEMESALEAAAPFIARAAQVQVLREMSAYWDRIATSQDYEPQYETWREVARHLRERADQIERGEV